MKKYRGSYHFVARSFFAGSGSSHHYYSTIEAESIEEAERAAIAAQYGEEGDAKLAWLAEDDPDIAWDNTANHYCLPRTIHYPKGNELSVEGTGIEWQHRKM